jgi:hypothetical protein
MFPILYTYNTEFSSAVANSFKNVSVEVRILLDSLCFLLKWSMCCVNILKIHGNLFTNISVVLSWEQSMMRLFHVACAHLL